MNERCKISDQWPPGASFLRKSTDANTSMEASEDKVVTVEAIDSTDSGLMGFTDPDPGWLGASGQPQPQPLG